MIGTALTRPSLTMQLTSGMDVFMHVHVQKMDTLCNYCDNVQPHDETFQFLSNVIIFMLFFLEITTNSNFCHNILKVRMVGSIIQVLLKI